MANERKTQQEQLEALIRLAYEGKAEWVDEVIRRCGYIHPRLGVPQARLIAEVPSLDRRRLTDWKDDGLEENEINGRKFIPLFPFIRFIYKRFVRPGRPSDAELDEFRRWREKKTKYEASLRELDYKERVTELIPRAEAERNLFQCIVDARTAFCTLPARIAERLEGMSAAEIEHELERQIDWICSEMSRGRFAMPRELSKKFDKLVKELRECMARATSDEKAQYDPATTDDMADG